MQQDTLERPSADDGRAQGKRGAGLRASPVLVRLEPGGFIHRGASESGADPVATTIAVAVAVAWGLDRGVRLVEQLERPRNGEAPVDPVEWDLRRRAVEARLAALVAHHAEQRCPLDFRVLEHFPPDDVDVADTVIGLYRGDGTPSWYADESTRRFLAAGPGSVLVVPETRHVVAPVRFARVMTPLDGSARAECALPGALAIARRHGAELLLVHAALEPPLLGNGPPDAEALALADELRARNRRIANDYLGELRTRYAESGAALRTCQLDAGDVRRRLVEAARAKSVDLMVVAAHGTSGHGDVPTGAVAGYVIEHAPVPVLMIGTGAAPCGGPLFESTRASGTRAASAAIGRG